MSELKRRKRRYQCNRCGSILLRVNDKMWYKGYCEAFGDCRLYIYKGKLKARIGE